MSDVKLGAYDAAEAADIAQMINETSQPPVFKKPRRRWGRIIIVLVVIAIIAAAALYIIGTRAARTVQTGASYYDHTVATRDITLNLSGTGTLQPADSYTVTTLISGEILEAPFEEGDVVEKDKMLYQVDSSDVATSIEQAQNSLAQTQRSYDMKVKSLEDLNVKAAETGTIIELLVEEGDKVSAGQTIAKIRNSAVMSLLVPFGTDDADSLYVGQSALVTLDGTFETLTGTISKVSPIEERLDGNILIKMVTIDVPNPGAIALDQAATAEAGGVACCGSGLFNYKGEATVTAAASGEVASMLVEEGSRVTKNEVIVKLESESLQNDILNSAGSLRDSELSLENRRDQLENYTIKSPIAGTIIEKNYKEGDTLESGRTLCVIFDLSYLTMTLNVDELDIASVEVGQKVTVTAEALAGRVYSGVVTKVNINGTTSGGVTSYPVTIRIDETEGLLPGMNVQASIIVSESEDTVAIPVAALSRGNRVLVKTDSAAAQTSQDGQNAQIPQGAEGMQRPEGFEGMQRPEGAEGMQRPEGAEGMQRPEGFEGIQPSEGAQSFEISEGGLLPGGMTIFSGISDAPEGYTYVQVTPGISDGEYIEILEGLSVGDIIAVPETVIPESQNFFGMMPAGGASGNVQRTAPASGGPVYSERTVVVGG